MCSSLTTERAWASSRQIREMDLKKPDKTWKFRRRRIGAEEFGKVHAGCIYSRLLTTELVRGDGSFPPFPIEVGGGCGTGAEAFLPPAAAIRPPSPCCSSSCRFGLALDISSCVHARAGARSRASRIIGIHPHERNNENLSTQNGRSF
jgi:hypothetical protein